MFIMDPLSALAVIDERGHQLRAEAETERLYGPSRTRRALASSLRRAADRLDPAPLGRKAPVPQLGAK